MAQRRPLIGINTTYERVGGSGVTSIKPSYWEAVVRAGGIPSLLPQLEGSEIIEDAVARVDGFVLIGGFDLDGAPWGAAAPATVVRVEPRREATDFALIDALIKARKPTLAICLGFQELNVAHEGTLHQDLLFDGPAVTAIRHYAKGGVPEPRHGIEIVPGTRLAEAMQCEGKVEVNSSHHQALDKIGKSLRIAARAEDGIVEAVEIEDHPFFIGVQWHPERLTELPEQTHLFGALIDHARSDAKA